MSGGGHELILKTECLVWVWGFEAPDADCRPWKAQQRMIASPVSTTSRSSGIKTNHHERKTGDDAY